MAADFMTRLLGVLKYFTLQRTVTLGLSESLIIAVIL